MIKGLLALLGCQLIGELVVGLTDAPIPGPVIGMVVLFAYLQLRSTPDDAGVVRTGQALLTHLQLLFVPAGVGVVAYVAVLREDALPIGAAVIGSWLLGLAVVGWGTVLLSRLLPHRPRPPEAVGPR